MNSKQNLSPSSSLFLVALFPIFLMACSKEVKKSDVPSLKTDLNYSTQKSRSEGFLAVPPSLTKPDTSNLFDNDRQMIASASRVLSSQKTADTLIRDNEQVKVRRLGPYRWLEVKSRTPQVFQTAKKFLIDLGFTLTIDDPSIGLLETEWKENKPNIPSKSLGMIRSTLARSLGQVFSEDKIDRFRIRVEYLNSETSEVFITHQSMVQQDVGGKNTWVFAASEPELEVEVAYRFLVYLGLTEKDAGSVMVTEMDNQQDEKPDNLNLFETVDGLASTMNESFNRSWLMLGWAIDRSDYIIYDRNRQEGIFYIRLGKNLAETKSGFLDQLMFWKERTDLVDLKVQVKLKANSQDNSVQINILSEEGEKIPSEQARIFLKDILSNI